ncbi:hypothetical protein MGU_07644 [Metarhizium guizhouense ARSEF 977]|uniref:Uncharacterized protein n=1 Tax=Metarhizium guizhouense (strain ARSEF 977) TaxID=1276136 RepID=A0A0B4GZR1_METGA|nr:hypothetical protein MGU_07644 [Metarhizium guizhouense ARSEF 977]
MADPFRGDGLFTADAALAALVQDPERLDRARARFSESPPSYRSRLSHNSTLSQSPDPPSDEQQRRSDLKWKLILEHRASFPSEQFLAQEHEEWDRITQLDPIRMRRIPIGRNYDELAKEKVMKRWVEQGIWNEEWKSRSVWRWKHEEPPDPKFESNKDKTAGTESRLFGPPLEERESTPRPPQGVQDLPMTEERRRIREREREASRPYHQFVYQVSKERELILDEMNPPEAPDFSYLNQWPPTLHQAALHGGEGRQRTLTEPNVEYSVSTPPDINTTAYERVKNTWVRRGIWNKKWGILPGMSWKHEQPLEEMLREEMGDDPVPQEGGAAEDRQEPSEAPRRPLFGAYPDEQVASFSSPLFDDSSHQPVRVGAGPNRIASPLQVAANGDHVLGQTDEPLEEACPGGDPAVLPNGETSQSSAASSPDRDRINNREAGRSILLSGGRRGERGRSVGAGLAPEIPRTALGPIRPSKVSKARRWNGTSTRRRPDGSEETGVQTPIPVSDTASAPLVDSSAQPRRSRRLQEAKRKTDEDSSAGGISTSSPKSAKPRGVVKRRSRTTSAEDGLEYPDEYYKWLVRVLGGPVLMLWNGLPAVQMNVTEL